MDPVYAEDPQPTEVSQEEPENRIPEPEIPQSAEEPVSEDFNVPDEPVIYTTVEEAGTQLREQMKNRDEEIVFYYDSTPVVCGNENGVYALWLKNRDNDWFGRGTQNEVWVSQWDGNNWQPAMAYEQACNPILDLDADVDAYGLHVAMIMDQDNDLLSEEDQVVIVDGSQITEESGIDHHLQYVNGTLYWNQNGHLVYMDPALNVKDTGLEIPSGFKLLDAKDSLVLLRSERNAYASYLTRTTYDKKSRTWGQAQNLTEDTKYVNSLSGFVDDEGDLHYVYVYKDIQDSQTPYDNLSTLSIVDEKVEKGLEIDHVSLDGSMLIENANVPLQVTIRNTGNQMIQGFKIQVLDEQETF